MPGMAGSQWESGAARAARRRRLSQLLGTSEINADMAGARSGLIQATSVPS
jgi:hypothetical protein